MKVNDLKVQHIRMQLNKALLIINNGTLRYDSERKDNEIAEEDFNKAEDAIAEAQRLCGQVGDEDFGRKVDANGEPVQ